MDHAHSVARSRDGTKPRSFAAWGGGSVVT
jgi:hypothetical protein